ncbi:MAG: DUF2341 domain-containing protein [Patescibacteria group bacterium]
MNLININYKKYLISIFLFFCFLFPLNVQAQCDGKGYTVVYVNGVFTPTEELAKADMYKLQDKYKEDFDISNINFITGYNPSHLAGLGDLIQAASQILEKPISDFDLKTILQRIHPQINTKKILLFGHSQGTFYTNELYNYLINNGIPKESIAVYNVATPADFVAGNGKYLTSQNDKVVNNVRNVAKNIKVNQPLPSNINIPLDEQNNSNGHSFSTVYLKGAPNRIIPEINNVIKNLDDAQQITNTSNIGCFNLPDQNFSYKTQKLIYLAADPVSSGIVKAGVATYNGIAFTGDILSTGVAVVLDPIVDFFHKQTVANIHDIKSLIGAIGQLFNRPDTDSKSSLQELSKEQSQQLEDALNGSQNLKNLITESANSGEQPESLNQEDTEQSQELVKPQEVTEKVKEPEKEKIPEPQYFAGDVVINELMPNPLENQNEWIELYNRTDKSIDLTNWTIEDNTAHPKTLKGKIIPSHSWLALNGGQDFSFQLNNSGDAIILKYNGNLIDSISYGDFKDSNLNDNAVAPLKGESLIRFPDGQDKNQDNRDFLITTTLTSGLANLFTKPEVLTPKTPDSDDKINNISYQFFQFQDAVINEIAWAGTKSGSTDEWIELYNNLDKPINLAGWRLKAADGSPNILLTGEIPARGYWLLERTNDDVVKNVTADQIYSGALEDSGETLELIDGNGNRIDFINQENGWLAGNNETKASLERINSTLTGVDANNWQTNNSQDFLWFDAKNNKILGTPKHKNSPKISNINQDVVYSNSSIPSPILEYQSYQSLNVIVNEISWMGTIADYNDEWIELYNNLDQEIDLSGWTLKAKDGSPDITLSGKISGGDFFILERTDDSTISNLAADQIYSGALGNSGEDLELRDGNNNLIDEINCTGLWFSGDNTTKATMERIDSLAPGNLEDNWQTAYYQDQIAKDAKNNSIFGSPKNKNTEKPEEKTKDTIPPEISLTQKPEILTNLDTANFEFSINEEGGVFCKIDEQNFESCFSPQIYQNLAEGNHIFYLKAIDQENNFLEITYSWTIDLTGPISSPTTSGIFNFSSWPNQINGIASSNVSSTDLSLVDVQIQNKSENKYLGYVTSTSILIWLNEPFWLETDLNENNWHFDLPVSLLTELLDSYYFISSRATDLVGNIQNTTSTTEFIFDSTPPVKVNNLKTENLGGLNLKLSWDAVIDNLSGIDHYEVIWGENTTSTIVNYLDLSVEDRELYSFKIRAVDKAGNFGEWSDEILYSVKLPSIVISEVQIAGQTADDEFIELYNPTDQEINLTEYFVKKKRIKTDGTVEESTLVTSSYFKDKIIEAQGYLLLARKEEYKDQTTPDILWPKSYSLTSNNTIILYNSEGKIIDKVGWGTAPDFETVGDPETSSAPESPANQSIERKPGYPNGNQQDTDNNLNDFSIQLTPNPVSSKGLWSIGWEKRKEIIIINNNTEDLTNFEVNINISYEFEMNQDFSDIRFTTDDKITPLNYGWEINDDGTDQKQYGVSATAVVKIPLIPVFPVTKIYMYYGNKSAAAAADLEGLSSVSEGNWFDHFTTNRLTEYDYSGASVNTSLSQLIVEGGGYCGPKDFYIKNLIVKMRKYHESIPTYPYPLANSGIEYRWQDSQNYFRVLAWGNARWPLDVYFQKIINNIDITNKQGKQFNNQEWGIYEADVYETKHSGRFSGSEPTVNWTDIIDSDLNIAGKVRLHSYDGNHQMWVDYLYIRQNVQIMPTVNFGE